MRVLIFIPLAGYRPYGQMESAYTNAKNYLLSQTSEHEIREYRCTTFPIDANRNCCVGHAIEGMQGFFPDTTIWIDADVVIPHDPGEQPEQCELCDTHSYTKAIQGKDIKLGEMPFARVEFDASGLASGIYFYRLTAGNEILTRRMLVIK